MPSTTPSVADPCVASFEGSALIMFAKAPVPGKVKTRLQPPLTPEEAAALHHAFVLDQGQRVLCGVVERGGAAYVSAAGDADHAAFETLASWGLPIVPQTGQGLGDRMARAIAWGLAQGHARVTLIGSDSPTLPLGLLADANARLDAGADVVITPSFDGGFVAISARTEAPALGGEIAWSVATTFAETVRALREDKRVVDVAGFWYDVDDRHDIAFLTRHLLDGLDDAADACAPRTASWLRAYRTRLVPSVGP